jgi:hypothetical protein
MASVPTRTRIWRVQLHAAVFVARHQHMCDCAHGSAMQWVVPLPVCWVLHVPSWPSLTPTCYPLSFLAVIRVETQVAKRCPASTPAVPCQRAHTLPPHAVD